MNCPICDKPADTELAPFCSKRCELLDLHKWLSGAYAVPAVELDDVDDELSDESEE